VKRKAARAGLPCYGNLHWNTPYGPAAKPNKTLSAFYLSNRKRRVKDDKPVQKKRI
jgi:hypothetical protein